MPHQDKDDLRTPFHELKEILASLADANLESVSRHGNASLGGLGTATLALLTFGWGRLKTLSVRFDTAQEATKRVCGGIAIAGSYQALMVALRSCGHVLLNRIREHLVLQLQAQSNWLFLGRPTFAVDGSQFAVPRTRKNLDHFAAASRKSKAAYKSDADHAKAKTTQIAVSVCLHLTSGLPLLWNTGGSADSERNLLLEMLSRLPHGSRMVMDAYYFGYQFWNRLITDEFTFVVPAGKNIELLDQLREGGKVKCRGNLVLYWPQTAIDAGGDPIVLSLVEVMVGRKRMFLLTNELSLSAKQLSSLYSKRWGVEVFFRLVKQSYERSKMESRTPANVELELQWTLLGVWMALTLGGQNIPANRRISQIRVLRTICSLVEDVARRSVCKLNIAIKLSHCFVADKSSRKSSKNSDNYPRKKRKRQTGEPTVSPLSDQLRKQALACLTQNHYQRWVPPNDLWHSVFLGWPR
jgi:hypothetical protein